MQLPIFKLSKKAHSRVYSSFDLKDAYKAFRQSSSGFIKNIIIKDFVYAKNNYKCAYCFTEKNLQIDHIRSVHFCFNNNLIDYCNSLENLQILCKKCNTSKKP